MLKIVEELLKTIISKIVFSKILLTMLYNVHVNCVIHTMLIYGLFYLVNFILNRNFFTSEVLKGNLRLEYYFV